MRVSIGVVRRQRQSKKGFGNLKIVSAKNKIIFSLVLAVWLTGCGLKTNPVPPVSVASQKQVEQKLTVTTAEKEVVLTWQLQNPGGMIKYVNIEKSMLGSAGNTCKDCPRTFERIGQLPVKVENNEYRFADSLVEKGKLYSYRLKLCDDYGVCRESQTVEIDFK